jgi:hypothetical protein
MRTKQTDTAVPEETEDLATVIRRNRRPPEEVARLAEGHRPFSYEEWQRKAPPATPEELAETEEFLRLRNLEREASIAAEAGVFLNGEPDNEPGRNYRTEPGE